MRLKTSTLIWTFLWSIFMGITVGSIGIGALFPGVNRITKPFVCSRGDLQLVTQDYVVSPVESGTTLTWYCVDAATGVRQEVSIFKMALIAGPFYGLLLFAAIFVWMWYRAGRRAPAETSPGFTERTSERMDDLVQRSAELRDMAASLGDSSAGLRDLSAKLKTRGARGSTEQRLDELKRLRDSGLISAQDYDSKKAEILKDL